MAMLFGEAFIQYQVSEEATNARRYLDVVMRLQEAYYQSTAAQMFISKAIMESGRRALHNSVMGTSFLEVDSDEDFDMEEDLHISSAGVPDTSRGTMLEGKVDEAKVDEASLEEDEELGRRLSKTGSQVHKYQLLGALNLFHSIKIMNLKNIYMAHDLQEAFFVDRALWLKLALFKDLVPPELLSVFYKRLVSTFIKINTLSLSMQTVSTFTTWLEDEVDLGVYLLANPGQTSKVDSILGLEIADDRLWAFTAYNKFATLQLTTFALDYYIDYEINNLMATGNAGDAQQMPQQGGPMIGMRNMQMPRMPGQSFLQTESKTEAKTKTKFYAALFAPFLFCGNGDPKNGAFGGYQTPTCQMHQGGIANGIYSFYQIYMTYSASSLGLQSAQSMKMAFNKADRKVGMASAGTMMRYSKQLFGAFASNLQQVANVGYITSLWEIYQIYQDYQTKAQMTAQSSMDVPMQQGGAMMQGMLGTDGMGGRSHTASLQKAREFVHQAMASRK